MNTLYHCMHLLGIKPITLVLQAARSNACLKCYNQAARGECVEEKKSKKTVLK